jgi:hypothetical protein
MYLISYDLRKARNYEPLWQVLREWKASRLLESLWLAELKGPASEIRRILTSYIDNDDGLGIIELKAPFDWATIRCQKLGTEWLKARSP